ncbi:MAG: UDP-glucose/iron transport system ATP-binding protein [Actinomycetota bacterium]|nr:UDP-glucose/iron transport system ATP-binding protein [Actinomycetota bacterium]
MPDDVIDFPLRVEALGLTRGSRPVLRNITTSFRKGVVTAVVGPSGAGKSSLLRCLNRLEEPDTGSVTLEGIDIRSLEPTALRRRVGMIFQTPVIFEGGVRANLLYGLPDQKEEKLSAALEAAGLPAAFLDRESSALSVGQAQRVCIARALVRDPEVILMDEPTSALDRDATARIESLLGSLLERELTIVLVTHDLGQARRVARSGILLMDGTVVAEGDVDQIEAAWPGEELS